MNNREGDKAVKRPNFALIILSVCCVAVLVAGVGVGSYYFGKNEDVSVNRTVKMYVADDSSTYSQTSELVSAVADSVVEIRTESMRTVWGSQYITSGAGSGVIIGHNSGYTGYYVVTNNHVIAGANEITVTLRSGTSYDAELIATDAEGDIAVVYIEESKTLNVATWGKSSDLQVGDELIAIGNPLGSLGGTVTKGILSAKERSIVIDNYTMTLLQTDTAINPGNSGGGLFNMKGHLVGVVNAKTSDEEVEGICFAIPSETASALVSDLIEYGAVIGRVDFGIALSSATKNDGSSIVYVTQAPESGDGFKQYDKIASINGREISTLLDYNNALASIKPDDEVEFVVYRGSMQQNIFGSNSVTFDSDPTTFTVTAKQRS